MTGGRGTTNTKFFSERGYRDVKAQPYPQPSGANDEWLLVLLYMCFISNHTAVESLHWTTPLTFLTGQTVDVLAIATSRHRTKV
jgi:hypothetical protein